MSIEPNNYENEGNTPYKSYITCVFAKTSNEIALASTRLN